MALESSGKAWPRLIFLVLKEEEGFFFFYASWGMVLVHSSYITHHFAVYYPHSDVHLLQNV